MLFTACIYLFRYCKKREIFSCTVHLDQKVAQDQNTLSPSCRSRAVDRTTGIIDVKFSPLVLYPLPESIKEGSLPNPW